MYHLGGQQTVPDTLIWHPDHVAALGTLVVEPSFFGSVYKFTLEKPEREMADLVGLARSHTSNFHVIEHFGLPVVVWL